MPTAETQTTICNKALDLLGEENITSLQDDQSLQARILRNHFDLSLNSVLEYGHWPFATVEEPLTRLDYPEYAKEQKYVYALPDFCILIKSIYKVFDRKHLPHRIDWDLRYIPELKKTCIICNMSNSKELENEEEIADKNEQLVIEFVSSNSGVSTYTPGFIRCLSAQLAADVSMAITHDMQRTQFMIQIAEAYKKQALQDAMNQDGEDKGLFIDPITRSRGF